MRSGAASFTRGSQLFETFGLLFAAGLKPILWVAGIAFTASIAWSVAMKLDGTGRYLCLMHAFAAAWHWMQFNADKPLHIAPPGLPPTTIAMRDALSFQPMTDAWQHLITLLHEGIIRGAILAVPAAVIYTRLAQRLGDRAAMRKHKRGATLTSADELLKLVRAYNRDEGRAERTETYKRMFGMGWELKAPLVSEADLVAEGMYLPYTIAGIPYPWRSEQAHTMLVGTTGTGKSTILKDLVRQLRQRHGRAVLFDLTGSFIEHFYDPETDIILNPFDTRCPHWSIFHDATNKEDFTSAAEALVPHDGGSAEPFWVQAARLLFVETCLELQRLGRGTNDALYEELMTAPLKHLHKLVESTVAGPLTDTDAKRMAESVRAVFNTNATALECLPNDGEYFSIRQWVGDTDNAGSILFVSARYAQLPTVRTLLTLWLNTAITTIMSGSTSPRDVKMWFLFDELGALHRLPAIEAGLQTARNYGGAFVLGVHTIAKLRDTYGDKIADTLGSLTRTKVMLATPDYGSAKWCSEYIGSSEWQQMDEGWSYGINNVRDAVTLTPRRQLEPLVLPETIMNLPSLTGYLKLSEGLPAAPVKLSFEKYPSAAAGFIARPPRPARHLIKEEDAGGDEGGRSNTADVEQAKRKPISDAEMRRRREKVILKIAREGRPQDRDAIVAQAMQAANSNDGPTQGATETALTSGLEVAGTTTLVRCESDARSGPAAPGTTQARRAEGDEAGEKRATSRDRLADTELRTLTDRKARDEVENLTKVEARQDYGDGKSDHERADDEPEIGF